jgi:hypothetical protein
LPLDENDFTALNKNTVNRRTTIGPLRTVVVILVVAVIVEAVVVVSAMIKEKSSPFLNDETHYALTCKTERL